MSKVAPRLFGIFSFAVLFATAVFYPRLIDENNAPLDNFFRTPFLGVLGFMISVTIASCTNIYLYLNRLETEGRGPFPGTKKSLKRSANSLIILFTLAFVILALKGMNLQVFNIQAILNSLNILITIFFISVMFDIARSVFLLPPERPKD